MRSEAFRLDLEADEAAMRDRQPFIGRLRDDREIGAMASDDRLGADARDLFVGHGSDDNVAAQPEPTRAYRCQQRRRKARLHVTSAAPVDPAILDPPRERLAHPRDADRVHVRIQHQRPTTAQAARGRHDVRPARRRLIEHDIEPCPLGPLRDEPRQLQLAGNARGKARVDRVDRDQRGGQLG